MANRLFVLEVTTPAGTAELTPVTTDWPLQDAVLEELEIITPAGHNGLTGIRVLRSFQQIIPYANLHYLVMNDERLVIPYRDQITASGLSIITYNTDVFDHTHYLRALISDLGTNIPATTANIPAVSNSALSSLTGSAPSLTSTEG